MAEYYLLEAVCSYLVHQRALGPEPISWFSVSQMPGFDTLVGHEINLVVCNWHFEKQSKIEILKPGYFKEEGKGLSYGTSVLCVSGSMLNARYGGIF